MEASGIFWAVISIIQGVIAAIVIVSLIKANGVNGTKQKKRVATIMAILLLVPNPLYAFFFKSTLVGGTTRYPLVPTIPLYYARVETMFGNVRGATGYIFVPFTFGDVESIEISITPLEQ